MTLGDSLKSIGLTEGEIKVYTALLHLGSSTMSKIHEKTTIERRNIYDILNKLGEKGMVTFTLEKGKKTFQVTHPGKLVSYVEEKEESLKVIKKMLEQEIPSLITLYKENKSTPHAEIYRGKEGFKAIAEDMYHYPEVWIIGGGGGIQSYLPHYWKFYNKKRIVKKILWHDLIRPGTLMNIFKGKTTQDLKKYHYYEYRILPPTFQSPNTVCMYGDKIVNMLWDESLFAVAIESKIISKSYFENFNLLWKQSE